MRRGRTEPAILPNWNLSALSAKSTRHIRYGHMPAMPMSTRIRVQIRAFVTQPLRRFDGRHVTMRFGSGRLITTPGQEMVDGLERRSPSQAVNARRWQLTILCPR